MTMQEALKGKLGILLILAFIVRMVLVSMTSQTLYEQNDSYLHRDWGRVAFIYGPAESYNRKYISNVGNINNLPPGATYMFGGMYYLHVQASKVINIITNRDPGMYLWMNDGTFANIFIRMPAVFSDLLIGLLIYMMVYKKDKKYALLCASLYLFNPGIIYNSSVWGQVDAVPVLFFILAAHFLMKKRYFISILFAVLSIFVKLSLLPLLPIYGVILLKKVPLSKLFSYSFIVLGLLYASILPISSEPHIWLIQFLSEHGTNVLDNITANAFNFWWLVLAPKLLIPAVTVNERFLFASYGFWGYFLYAIAIIPLLFIIWKKKNSELLTPDFLMGLFALTSIIYFLFLPTMHERYFITFFPFMTAYVGFKRKYFKLLLVLIGMYSINVYSTWQYKVSQVELLANPIIGNRMFPWIISLIITAAGVYFYIQFIREHLNKYSKR